MDGLMEEIQADIEALAGGLGDYERLEDEHRTYLETYWTTPEYAIRIVVTLPKEEA